MTNKEPLTAKQEQIFNFIKEEISSKGYPPSVREICDAVNLSSTSSVHAHLKTLEKKGYIKSVSSKNRAIEVLDDEFNALMRREITNVPLIGKVAAGTPILATENVVDYIPFPVDQLPNKETFMLTVKGDSMINMGIFDGDNLLVQKQNTARNGDVIVALVEDSATVKRFFKENGHIRLQPENDSMDPIIVNDCAILGKVIGLIRMNII